MISERTLKKWRREALSIKAATNVPSELPVQTNRNSLVEWQTRILRMTQELLDQHLLRRKK